MGNDRQGRLNFVSITNPQTRLRYVRSCCLAAILCGSFVSCIPTPEETPVADLRSLVEPVTDHVIHLTALVSVEPSRAFEYFTSSELLQVWLTFEADVEPEVGGRYELFWDPSDRENNSTIGCRITALAQDQLLSFQWRSPEQFKAFANTADPLTHVVVTFIPEDTGTRIHLVHSGWRSGAEWDEARIWQERAWTGGLRKLEEIAEP